MAYTIRKVNDAMIFALVEAHNLRQEESVASLFHADTTQTTSGDYKAPTVTDDLVTAADASNLATSVTLVNDIKAVMNRHFADTYAHDSAVSAAIATADATDLATGITLANAMRTAYGTHLAAANVHFTNDATNTIAATAATDQTELNTLLNEMKDDLNAHIVSAPAGAMIKLTPA